MCEPVLQLDHKPDRVATVNEDAGMSVVGEDFKHNRLYVPQVLIAARAMKAGLAILKPLLADSGAAASAGTIVLGTVKGDLHDIGKNLVGMMLEGGGYGIIDLQVDVTPEQFLEAVQNEGASVIAMSALLTTTMPAMKQTINALEEEGIRSDVKVLVGGAPVTQKFADEIGADGYAENAAEVVDRVKAMLA